MIGCRDACAPAEVSFPAGVLRDALVARWVREHSWAVDVRTVAELHSAISVGIHPVRMTVHADQLGSGGIRRASAAGVGGLVLSRREQIATLRASRTHHVLLRMTDATMRVSHNAVDAVIGCRSTVFGRTAVRGRYGRRLFGRGRRHTRRDGSHPPPAQCRSHSTPRRARRCPPGCGGQFSGAP